MKIRDLMRSAAIALLMPQLAFAANTTTKPEGVMLMNRIGPSSSELFIANADGTNERKFLKDSAFDYHANYSPDGKFVVFTSERNGDGNSDLFRANADGTNIELLVGDSPVEDAGALSPDGTKLAFVSTRDGYRANVWTLDLKTRELHNLTGNSKIQGDQANPDGFFRPAWSPDGKQIAFSSDRNTDWRGHDDGRGWEHTQELSIYTIDADGKNFRRIASKPGYCLGSPRWSADGKQIIFYEMTTEQTWGARRPNEVAGITSQIVGVDIASGARTELTSGPGLKVFPQFTNNGKTLAYQRKGGKDEGLAYKSGAAPVSMAMRSPTWSPDGKSVIYEKVSFAPRPQNKALYSWDPQWEYKHTDVFPGLSKDGKLVITEKAKNSAIVIMDPDGSNRQTVFDPREHGGNAALISHGLAGAFAPSWSPDGQWITFGVGVWFQERRHGKATVMRIRRDGTGLEALTDGTVHSGFPSYSADGKEIVFRTWSESGGSLKIINLDSHETRVLTSEYDNLPGWSPDGKRIVFTRKVDAENFDIFTICPDGSDLLRLTTNRANDGHAVWTADGRIMWTSGIYGFREEAALYDNTFQPYGQIFIMDADDSNKKILTDSLWEDSMPLYLPFKNSSN